MTTLRETLAMALAYRRPLKDNSQDWKDTPEDIKQLFRADAGRVIQALATWEPSDAVVLAAMIGYHCAEADGVPLSCGMRVALRKALRAMAEEGA